MTEKGPPPHTRRPVLSFLISHPPQSLQHSAASVPSHHRQIIVDPFCHEDLMDVDNTIVEGSRTCRKIQIPHADEPLIKHLFHFVQMFQIVLSPAAERAVIVE